MASDVAGSSYSAPRRPNVACRRRWAGICLPGRLAPAAHDLGRADQIQPRVIRVEVGGCEQRRVDARDCDGGIVGPDGRN